MHDALMADVVGKYLLQFNAGTMSSESLILVFADFSPLGLGIN